jgi:ribosome-associated heat shock protein Hsp15
LRTVVVRALSGVRGPASTAALLYDETSKRDRRELDAWRQPPTGWNERWSASIDDDG